ncbi:MAG: glycosyltransferase [Ignavibacteriae bacterium]|nr:glycosyltransferase [Ignavibacteriota bacterium]NOG97552.1 glycosyltransferase [Ignavibacteriota bacterium]
MIDLSIIIVNYNVKEFLQNLLDSLKKAAQNISHEIIIVDNASDDGSVEVIEERYPHVKLIKNEKNIGFGKANNIALSKAEGKFLLLINPDTIVKEDTFEKLIDFINKTDDAGIVGCKVLNPDGTLQLPCRRGFPGPWTSFTKITGLSKLFPKSKLFARYHLTYLDENETYEVDAISGAFMFIKREAYEKVGGFDPDFFMYGEDLDLCYRAQKSGFKVYYFHETEIIHYKGESTKRSRIDETKVFYNAMHLFVKKHFSASFLVQLILRAAIGLRTMLAFANLYRLIIFAAAADFIFVAAALYLAEEIYSVGYWKGFPAEVKPWIYIVPAFAQVLISGFVGAYKKNSISVLKCLAALGVGVVLISASTFFLKQYAFSRAVVLITYAILFIALPLWRVVFKIFKRAGQTAESRKRRTLVVGTGETGSELARKLKSSITNIHHIIGLIGNTRKTIGEQRSGFKVIGSLENISKIIAEHRIDKVIFVSNEISFEQQFAAVSECQGTNVEFVVAGSEQEFLVGKSAITMLDDIPLLKVSYNISSLPHKIAKGILDFILSVPILLFVYPFIYFFNKLSKKENQFINFILSVPKVFLRKKSFVGPDSGSMIENLYIGKIGLTGLWFTEHYDKTDFEETNKLNIYYAKNQNIWMDLEILGKTFAKMFD